MTAPDPKFGPHPGAATGARTAIPTLEGRIRELEQRVAVLEQRAVTALATKRDDIIPIRGLSTGK